MIYNDSVSKNFGRYKIMDLLELKKIKKEKKMTLFDIAEKSGVPKRTVDDIFSGKTKNPRIDTMEAIEKALGIDNQVPEVSDEQKELLQLIQQLDEDEVEELSNYIDFIIAKRK